MKKFLLRLCPLLLIGSSLHAQTASGTLAIGKRDVLVSKILNESRELYLYSPENQKTGLPLILVFDGEVLIPSVVSAVRFMNYSQELPAMPEAIVVGIPNTDRNRDMPIPQVYGRKGEVNFSRFLSEELMPMLKQHYLLNGHVVLIGHSQGGLFVSYLLAQSPEQYPSVVALDAPLEIDPVTLAIKKKIVQSMKANPRIRYASMETAFGWGKDGQTSLSDVPGAVRMEYPGETHESMPHKAIYDGLKFIYRGFAPPKRDMKLVELLHHYKDVSERFGFDYEVPGQVLLASANRKIMDNRKADAMELLNFAEEKYGASDDIAKLRTKATRLSEALDPLVEGYLNHAKPSAAEVKPYLGRWVGELMVPKGQPVPTDFEIKAEDGKGKMVAVLPWPPFDRAEVEILFVDEDGSLVFGRKNRGAGLVISTARVAENGHLIGVEKLIGFTIPEDVPDEVKEMMKFTLANPNTFDLKRGK